MPSPGPGLRTTLALGAGGEPPGKPLEDRALADAAAGLFVVADGVTRSLARGGRYPDPSPSAEAAAAAAGTLLDQLRGAGVRIGDHAVTDAGQALRSACAAANDAVARVNRARNLPRDFLDGDRAGAVVAVAWLDGSTLHCGHLGDCAVRLLRHGRLERLTRLQTAAAIAWRREHGDNDDTTVVLRRDARNGAGHPAAYGCLTGESAALDFFETSSWPLAPGDRLFISSDGVALVFDDPLAFDREAAAHDLVERACVLDRADGRKRDDKALIVVDIDAA